ncbi:uncharacterized protein [Nicotiana sylvestris]|uniref:uncharacterized protein n=1 Tax=Nicotiana sylvestris TaxID=4096 RepID=UPI00388C6AFC
MCKYHGTHGHKTEDYRKLREEVARLFNEGHLREFLSDRAKNHIKERDANRKNEQEEPHHVIHMIVEGVDIPQRPVFKRTKGLITRKKRTQSYVPGDFLSFYNEEVEGSATNIIRPRVIEQRGLQDQIVPASRVLNGFDMARKTMKEEIVLPVNVAGTIQDTKFHVIKGDIRYNALLRKPWIHNMKAVPSTLH